ncbi:hypothetical protein J7K55_01305, partial [Candidatus Aerophobetes bacterium]|nr:hypothetical protein [Candidatus Aerophobetes bacterium]
KYSVNYVPKVIFLLRRGKIKGKIGSRRLQPASLLRNLKVAATLPYRSNSTVNFLLSRVFTEYLPFLRICVIRSRGFLEVSS